MATPPRMVAAIEPGAETFVFGMLLLSTITLAANVLLWVPIIGKAFFLVGKILRIVGFIIGILDIWALLAWYGIVAAPI